MWLARNEQFSSSYLEPEIGEKLRFSHMDSKDVGLEIPQSVRDGIGFANQSKDSIRRFFKFYCIIVTYLCLLLKEWRDILWLDQKSQPYSGALWWSPLRLGARSVWHSKTNEGDSSADEEENEIRCSELKHSKTIMSSWTPKSQTYNISSDFNYCLTVLVF